MELPKGIVTIIFTDIQGSTDLWEKLGNKFKPVLEDHNNILRKACSEYNGIEVRFEGDSYMLAFTKPRDAISFAVKAQYDLSNHKWPKEVGTILVRMGMHTGEPLTIGKEYFGSMVNKAKRVQDATHGGQILISAETAESVKDNLPMLKLQESESKHSAMHDARCTKNEVSLIDLKFHRLKGLERQEQLFQVTHPSLPKMKFPAPRTLAQVKHNLPVEMTSFIDREDARKTVKDMLKDKETRLITITGTGGMGKTRLALHIAAESIDEFPDGVWFVELAEVKDKENVVPEICLALGLMPTPGLEPQKQLGYYLQNKKTLIILDNFEQVTAAASYIQEIFAKAQFAKAIVTTRIPLNLPGEILYELSPLSAPIQPLAFSIQHLADLSQYASVMLFLERASRLKQGFKMTKENSSAIASICTTLEGIPLAIELASSKIKYMTPQEIHVQLIDKFKVLSTPSPGISPRHQKLYNTIDWSYQLLTEQEKQLFAQLSVFSGGFFLEAAQEICQLPENVAQGFSPAVSELIYSLKDKSLLSTKEVLGKTRFSMLEIVREYAKSKLKKEELKIIAERHAKYFLKAAIEYCGGLEGPEPEKYIVPVKEEVENVRAGMDWAINDKNGELAFGYAEPLTKGVLSDYYYLGDDGVSLMKEKRQRLERALPIIEQTYGECSYQVAEIKCLLPSFYITYGFKHEYDKVQQLTKEAVEIAQKIDDKPLLARALFCFGRSFFKPDPLRAKELVEKSLSISKYQQDKRFTSRILYMLSVISDSLGDTKSAREYAQESMKIVEEIKWKIGVLGSLQHCGWIEFVAGNFNEAEKLYKRALTLNGDDGGKLTIRESLKGLCRIAMAQKKYIEARKFSEQVLQQDLEANVPFRVGWSFCSLGRISYAEHKYEEAKRFFKQALQLIPETNLHPFAGDSLYNFGLMAWESEEKEKAVIFQVGVDKIWKELQVIDSSKLKGIANELARLEKEMGKEAFEKAKAKAEAMSIDEIVKLALED